MSDKLPTLQPAQASMPPPQEWAMIKEQASLAVKSGFLPNGIKTPEQAAIIALKGREMGIPPMQAFAHIHVINGKPTISAELMLALIYRNVPGAIVNFIKTDAHGCEIEARRPGGKSSQFKFTLEDAKTAGVLSKGTWSQYPAAMCRARCISAMARAMFPDALMGASYTAEELGAEVTEEGEVIEEPKSSLPPRPTDSAKSGQGGDWVVPFGKKHFGKRLRDIDPAEIQNFMDYLRSESAKKGEPIGGNAEKFIRNAERYFSEIIELENTQVQDDLDRMGKLPL